jgi:hypothetical protein
MSPPQVAATIRRLLLALLTFGIVATTTDLMLLGHYEDIRQYTPLALNGLAFLTVLWHLASGSAASIRTLQGLMAVFVVAAVLGITFHYQGNLEFQLEINPEQSSWDLFNKVIRAKAPPALAPGVMAQLGFLGLIFTYRHPALTRTSEAVAHSRGDNA